MMEVLFLYMGLVALVFAGAKVYFSAKGDKRKDWFKW